MPSHATMRGTKSSPIYQIQNILRHNTLAKYTYKYTYKINLHNTLAASSLFLESVSQSADHRRVSKGVIQGDTAWFPWKAAPKGTFADAPF